MIRTIYHCICISVFVDGITLAPWKCGQLLVWDATCPDTYAPSYATIAVAEAGAAANQEERKKQLKYAHLGPGHIFTPIAIESSGVFGTETLKFLKDLGHHLKLASGESSAYPFLLQRLSGAVQCGNAASVMGSLAQSRRRIFSCNVCLFVISYVIIYVFVYFNNNNNNNNNNDDKATSTLYGRLNLVLVRANARALLS